MRNDNAIGSESPDLVTPEDRRQHLQFIQAAIGRMATASTTAKGWLLTIAAATYSFALVQHQPWVAALGCGAALLFGYLDAHYLAIERQYRHLYVRVSEGDKSVAPYSMVPKTTAEMVATNWAKRLLTRVKHWHVPAAVWMSWSIFPFYLAVVAGGVVTFLMSGPAN